MAAVTPAAGAAVNPAVAFGSSVLAAEVDSPDFTVLVPAVSMVLAAAAFTRLVVARFTVHQSTDLVVMDYPRTACLFMACRLTTFRRTEFPHAAYMQIHLAAMLTHPLIMERTAWREIITQVIIPETATS